MDYQTKDLSFEKRVIMAIENFPLGVPKNEVQKYYENGEDAYRQWRIDKVVCFAECMAPYYDPIRDRYKEASAGAQTQVDVAMLNDAISQDIKDAFHVALGLNPDESYPALSSARSRLQVKDYWLEDGGKLQQHVSLYPAQFRAISDLHAEYFNSKGLSKK